MAYFLCGGGGLSNFKTGPINLSFFASFPPFTLVISHSSTTLCVQEPRGKYTLLDQTGGDLLVHHTSTYDTYKKYICKTEHMLTGIRRRSIQPARLTLTGRQNYIFRGQLYHSGPGSFEKGHIFSIS